MKKDDDKEKDEQDEISPGALLAVAATLFGAPILKKGLKDGRSYKYLTAWNTRASVMAYFGLNSISMKFCFWET